MWKKVLDNALHTLGGAAIAVPIALWPSAWSIGVAFAAFGLLREQAQRSELGWLGAFVEYTPEANLRWRKLLEAVTWGIGGALTWVVLG